MKVIPGKTINVSSKQHPVIIYWLDSEWEFIKEEASEMGVTPKEYIIRLVKDRMSESSMPQGMQS